MFITDDPEATAWRLLSVLDGLTLQVVAHDALITRDDVLAWARTAAARELGASSTPEFRRVTARSLSANRLAGSLRTDGP